MEFITGVYLFFIFVSFYFSFLLFLLFFKNRKTLFADKIGEDDLSLSIIIPCYNEEKSIAETIKSVLDLDYKNLKKIVVVDDCSTDNSYNIIKSFAKKYPKVLAVQTPKNTGKASGSKNYGLKFVETELVGFTDADSYPERDSILRMVDYFKDKKTGGVTSSILVKNPKTMLEKMQAIEYALIAWARKLLDYVGSVYVTPGPLSIYRKKLLDEIGGFDEDNLTEDIEIAWKILNRGYRNRMCLSARVHTTVPTSIKKWWRQRLRWDIGGLQTAYKYKSTVFKKKYGIFGLFITPRFIFSHILSLAGFSIFIYIILTKLIYYLLSLKYSYIGGSSPFTISALNLLPTIFTFFIVLLFILSFAYLLIGLNIMKKAKVDYGNKIHMLIYLIFYLSLYPLILIHSIYCIITKNIKW